MYPKLEAWTVVIVGYWNPRVFTPQWVAQTLLHEQNITLEFGVINADPSLRFTSPSVLLMPTNNNLQLAAKDTSDATLQRMEEVATRALELLSHTPIAGVGINFGFSVADAPPDVLALFKTSDQNALSEVGYEIVRTDIQRAFQVEDRVMNLTCSFHDGGTDILLNFHSDAPSTEVAIEKLRGQVLRSRDIALKLLDDVYHLTLDTEEET